MKADIASLVGIALAGWSDDLRAGLLPDGTDWLD